MSIITPGEQFKRLLEAEIQAALRDPNPGNPIACEVARLIEGYTANFKAFVQQSGYVPSRIFHPKADSPIEAVAMQLASEAIRQTLEGN